MYKQMGLGSYIADPITTKSIYSMGAFFVDDADLYTSRDVLTDDMELLSQTQNKIEHWNGLLKAS